MNGIFSRRSAAKVLGVTAIAFAVAGCVLNSSTPDWYRGEQSFLRYQVDAPRGRLWALTAEGVELYEVATRNKVAQVALPDWLWAGQQYACPPDLAIGPRGEAVISSNVVPTLWRVDPVTLAASKHELALDEDTGKDVGFTALAYSAKHGAYFGVSGMHGSLWRIDPLLKTARGIPPSAPLPRACGLAVAPREYG